MRNNGGGHYNHEMFWQCMQAKKEGNAPIGNLQLAINKAFGSFDEFKNSLPMLAKIVLEADGHGYMLMQLKT